MYPYTEGRGFNCIVHKGLHNTSAVRTRLNINITRDVIVEESKGSEVKKVKQMSSVSLDSSTCELVS